MRRIDRDNILTSAAYEDLDFCDMAERWMLAWRLAREEDGTCVPAVWNAMQTVADHIDGPAGSSISLFPDGSLIAWSAGEDTLHPDLDNFVAACGGDRGTVKRDFPGAARWI